MPVKRLERESHRAPCRVDDAQHAEITERPASRVPQLVSGTLQTNPGHASPLDGEQMANLAKFFCGLEVHPFKGEVWGC